MLTARSSLVWSQVPGPWRQKGVNCQVWRALSLNSEIMPAAIPVGR